MNIIERLDREINERQLSIVASEIRARSIMIAARHALNYIQRVIESTEARCMAVDGPVTPTHQEITDAELRQIYKLAGGKIRK